MAALGIWLIDGSGDFTGMALTALTAFMIAELCNRNILLRYSSRMVCAFFVVLITASPFFHAFQSGHIIMQLTLLSYFSLFATFQQSNAPGLTYTTYLFIGIGALLYPKLIWIVPVYWLSQIFLHSMTVKHFMASLLGVMTPLWIGIAFALFKDRWADADTHIQQMIAFQWGGYDALSLKQWLAVIFASLAFFVGVCDFQSRNFFDKSHTRVVCDAIISFGVLDFILLMIQPTCFRELFPMFLVNSSILSGHYIATATGRAANFSVILISLAAVVLIILNIWML